MDLNGRTTEHERAGAAPGRRERRLRSWTKHDLLSTDMALDEKLHHSAKSGGAERTHRNRTQPLQLRRERSARKTRCGQRTPPQFCRWGDVTLADATVTFLLAGTPEREAAKVEISYTPEHHVAFCPIFVHPF